MTKFGEETVMDLGVVESFTSVQVIPSGMEERYGVLPFVLGETRASRSAGTDTARSSDGQANGVQDQATENAEDPLEKAYKEGYDAAKVEIAATQAELASRVEETLATLTKALESTEQKHELQTLQLAMLIAEKLARRALHQDPASLLERAMDILSHDQADTPLSVVADPGTAAILRSQITKLRSSLQVSAIEIEEDNRLSPGDLVLSRGAITLDARMATRLGRIQRALERELGLEVVEGAE